MLTIILFVIPLVAAVVVAIGMQFWKRESFNAVDFMARVLWLLAIFIPVSILLFLGWCVLAVSSIRGPLN